MHKRLVIFAAVTLMASTAAIAQSPTTGSGIRYKWHDAQGKVHFSDSLTAEAMKYGFDAVNDQGLVIQHVPRQLTPEERAAANQLAAEQAKKQRIEQDRINADAQMLEAYPHHAAQPEDAGKSADRPARSRGGNRAHPENGAEVHY
jgi:hypothetical protein